MRKFSGVSETFALQPDDLTAMSPNTPSTMRSQPLISVRLAVALLILLVNGVASMQVFAGAAADEYKIKAALIYKLSKFVDFPRAETGNDSAYFGVCLLGDDEFGATLDALEGRTVSGKPIVVRRFSQSDSVRGCQILFISASKRAFLVPILAHLQNRSILTIGDIDGFAESGGMIQFTRGERSIGFKINLESARRSGLTIAAPLLQLATVVDATKEPPL